MSRINLKLDWEAIRRRIDKEKAKFARGEFTRALEDLGVNPKIVTNVHGKAQQKPSIEYIVAVGMVTQKPVEHFLYGRACGEPPGQEIWPKPISDYGEKYGEGEKCPFKDPEMALRMKENLVLIEKLEPLEYRWLYEKIAGKADYLRLKKTGDDT